MTTTYDPLVYRVGIYGAGPVMIESKGRTSRRTLHPGDVVEVGYMMAVRIMGTGRGAILNPPAEWLEDCGWCHSCGSADWRIQGVYFMKVCNVCHPVPGWRKLSSIEEVQHEQHGNT